MKVETCQSGGVLALTAPTAPTPMPTSLPSITQNSY